MTNTHNRETDLGDTIWELPPLILHPFADRASSDRLLENSRTALMACGLVPGDGNSQQPCFALEALHPDRVFRESFGQHLDGDVAIQLCVGRPVHCAHASFTQLGYDAIMCDRLLRAHRARFQASYHFPAEMRANRTELSVAGA
jgi:hypothetical protein